MNDLKPPSRFKFRAWDEYNEIMYYSDKEYEDCFFGFDKGVVVAWLRKIVPQTLDEPAHEVGEPIKAFQSTGLQDKNGTEEVYQKDIISYSISETQHYKGVVEWSDDSCGFIVRAFWQKIESWGKGTPRNPRDILIEGFCSEVHGFSRGNTLNIVILGNEFQNPDLLKETK